MKHELNLCLCGPRSRSGVTGVAMAFDLLVQGCEARSLSIRVVDSTRGGAVAKSGAFAFRRAFDTICVILSVWWHLCSCGVYYATMSTSSLGFIRDYLTVGFAKFLGRRTVLHLHGGGFEDFYTSQKPWMQSLIRSNLVRTDTVIILGELLKEQFHCIGDTIKSKLVVVPNGLTLGVDEPTPRAKSLPEKGRVELLYLSSLMPSKGFFDVLQAMALLERKYPKHFHLNLCGSFIDAKTETAVEVFDESTLLAFIKGHQLDGCVTFHGQVLGKEKDLRFEESHIFLLPTSYPWEGQPLSIIEALAYRTPVITCFHKGIPELVKNGKTGSFVDAGSPESIASTVFDMVSDATSYSIMSQSARMHYEKNFKREVHLERLIKVILL
tara:strand:- start:431 stop:1576 length:1146 start_codon:yes stop_codon:yes gene_type:complete